MRKPKSTLTELPRYKLENFRPLHRLDSANGSLDPAGNSPDPVDDAPAPADPSFGYNQLDKANRVQGFELYSSEGLTSSTGPLKSEFYRVSITLTGTLDMQIGLEQYKHQPRTICFTYPGQIFSKWNISQDAFGYYALFEAGFLQDLIPAPRIAEEFPFLDLTGQPLFQLSPDEMKRVVELVHHINDELQQNRSGKVKAIKMYVYLLLLEAKRSYERQHLHLAGDSLTTGLATGSTAALTTAGLTASGHGQHTLIARFRQSVSQHYLTMRKVAGYATLLGVTPNHLSRTVKEMTGQTASEMIAGMLVLEAKALLKYTEASVSGIAYQLDFSDPASFSRFFKKATRQTPLEFRSARD